MTAGKRTGLVARARAALRRLLGRPHQDWAGPDVAAELARGAAPIARDDRHEVVWLGGEGDREAEALRRALAESGHRVFAVGVDARLRPGAVEVRESAPRLLEVRLRAGDDFEALERLRRGHSLGATVAVASGDPSWSGLAERFRAERGWPLIAAADATSPEALANAFPLVSIVIVTYGNRDVNALCLESLFARTEWPRHEVIVVDNGSSDGTPALLEGLARARPDLDVVALPENRGFPAACNLGLARAKGDVLVLLNNDTVLTRGWLTALVRHLTTEPRLGLVGPVTNAIANEAKVDVGYRDLGGLADWASDWTSAHDLETFPISMLAFFCVAMRRDVFEAVGPLDERFGLGLFEDGDYNRRVRALGLETRVARDAFVHHWQNTSFRRLGREAYLALYAENKRRFEEKWGKAPGPAARR
ncbi:MAG TPA: glycosyltransferase family 2 protein [Thermoanaerobaculia bacterium]|nr:glycosyltransferase family 2 protein [Thermoanaerobaculia bacterium]